MQSACELKCAWLETGMRGVADAVAAAKTGCAKLLHDAEWSCMMLTGWQTQTVNEATLNNFFGCE